MSLMSDLLVAVRGRRQAKFASVSEKYDSFVTQLAKGVEVDVDELADTLDELDKSDEDLSVDVSLKQRRIATAIELERLKKVAKEIPKLEATVKQLDDELSAIIAAKRPVIAEAAERLKAAQLEAERIGSMETDLLNHGVPMHIQQRKEAVIAKRNQWGPRIREYEAKIQAPKSYAQGVRNRLEVLDQRIARAKGQDVTDLQTQRKSLVDDLAIYENQIKQLEPMKAQLDGELREIEAEEREIKKLLMKP